MNATARLPAPPNLVVFSRLADESLWAKVNLAGFDVLITPFDPEDVLRIAFAPWSRPRRDSGAAPLELEERRLRTVGECPDLRTNGKVMK